MYVYVVTNNNDGECMCVTPNLNTAKRAVLKESAIYLCSYIDNDGDYTSQDFKREYGKLRKLVNSFQEVDEEWIEYSPCETWVIKKMEVED